MVIRKQIEIEAPPERVWPYVATADGYRQWSCTVAERYDLVLEPRVGGRFEETMTVAGEEHHLFGEVTVYEPPTRFAYAYSSTGPQGVLFGRRTVAITLAEERGRTRVTLEETGFENVPAAHREANFRSHERGWTAALRDLVAILAHDVLPTRPLEVAVRRTIPAPPETVFRALVEPQVLAQWFCDSAEVDPRPSGTYAFGGPHAYGGPETARGHIQRLERNRLLAFTWPLGGSDTAVTVELDGSDKDTELVVRHVGVARLPMESASPKEHLEVVWLVLIRQLAAHLAGRRVPRFDFAEIPPPVVEQEVVVPAPVARVWEMLTVPAQMNRWIARDAQVDVQVGGRYSYGWPEEAGKYGPMNILELDPPHRLVISWHEGGVVSRVSWNLSPDGVAATRLRLTHEGLSSHPGVLRDYRIGWWDYLAALRWSLDTEGAAAR
jgi:uncharacterized protein YndB with AHSA1/START domain